jgi:hypothetical protein
MGKPSAQLPRNRITKNRTDIRALDIAEACPLHLKPGVASQGQLSNLGADMLAFAITIRPDEQCLGIASLRLDILRN